MSQRTTTKLCSLVCALIIASLPAPLIAADVPAPAAQEQITFQGLPINATLAERDEFVARYEGLPEPKALAMALAPDGTWALGWASQAGNVLAAIGGSLGGCERARQRKSVAAPCEVLRVNDEELELGLALKKRLNVDDGDRPTLLWRFTNKKTVVYVGGSLHGFKASLYPLPDAFEEAYESSDQLILEVNLADVTQRQLFELRQKYTLLPDGQTLDDVLPPEVLLDTKRLVESIGVPWEALKQLTPASLTVELTQAMMMIQGLLPTQGLDQYFLQRALQGRKPIGELESIEFQFALLQRMPTDLQAENSEVAVKELKDSFTQLLDAWYVADTDKVWELLNQESKKSPELKTFMHQVFEERNHGMAARIADLLKGRKKTYMVLVGAGHLAGDEGIIRLLKDKGFKGVQLRRNGRAL